MPFRDRVARRFGETVSAPHSTLPPPDHGYYMTPALPYAHDLLPTPPSTPQHCSDPADGHDFYLDEYDCTQSDYNPPSTVADPRAGLERGRRAGHGRGKNTRVVELKSQDTTRQDALVCGTLGPQTRRSERISKSKNSKSSSARPKGPGSRQVAATTGSSRSTRSSCTPTYQDLLNTSDGCQWGGRATRSRSKMTDDGGKQLSPTSPFLSCKYLLSCCSSIASRGYQTNSFLEQTMTFAVREASDLHTKPFPRFTDAQQLHLRISRRFEVIGLRTTCVSTQDTILEIEDSMLTLLAEHHILGRVRTPCPDYSWLELGAYQD